MARPKKPDNEQLGNFTVRLSAKDRAIIDTAAEKAGVTPSEYIRLCAIRGTVRVIHDKNKADPALMLHLLAIGNNLNQIARKLNATDRAPANLDDTIFILRGLLTKAGQGYDS